MKVKKYGMPVKGPRRLIRTAEYLGQRTGSNNNRIPLHRIIEQEQLFKASGVTSHKERFQRHGVKRLTKREIQILYTPTYLKDLFQTLAIKRDRGPKQHLVRNGVG